jgi:DNA-binding MarR family transcriptional regulator
MTLAGGHVSSRSDDHEQAVAQEIASIEAQLENLRALITTSSVATVQIGTSGLTLTQGAFVKLLIADRRARNEQFPAALFADPAWDILLDLYVAHADGLLISVTSAVIAADVPASTALRWISHMTKQGYLRRSPDPHDRRRVHVELAENAITRIENYLQAVSKKWGVIIRDSER